MLAELRLQNFRGFENHVVPFRPQTWMVGRNNAGKTTVTTAITLLSRVTNRWGRLPARVVPGWVEDPVGGSGVAPSLTDLGLNPALLFHGYNEPPARIEASFTDGSRVLVYLGPDAEMWATALDPNARPIATHGRGATQRLTKIAVLPQVAPLEVEERILDTAYVRRSATTTTSSLHFRNHLFQDLVRRNYLGELEEEHGGEHYAEFCRLVEETWPGLQIRELIWEPGQIGDPLALELREGPFVVEAAHMGHGLQMWLQVMWFLARTRSAHAIVLDEPEVYTHADVQHRLVRVLQSRPNSQVIVATHSVEILSDVDPEDVLVIDRSRPSSGFTGSFAGLQRAVERLGGVGSLQLARLWAARRMLLVEGDDVDFLAQFHRALFPRSAYDLRTLPRMELGGWGGFSHAVGGGMLLRNAGGEEIVPYCILDSDYHTQDEIDKRYAEAARVGVELHIWRRKEIESYLLVPSALQRVLGARVGTEQSPPSTEEIAHQLDILAAAQHDRIVDRIAEGLIHANRGWGPPKANPIARAHLKEAWQTQEGRWGICNPKELLSELSSWATERCGVSFGPLAVAYQLREEDLPDEVRALVTAIEEGSRLQKTRTAKLG
jgi:hypothetical protein